MNNATTNNNSSTLLPAEIAARPVSAVACVTFLGVGLWIGHAGISALLPNTLATPLTLLFGSVAVLQWLAIGRWRSLKTAGATQHAGRLVAQICAFALLEIVLYGAGVINLGAEGGISMEYGSAGFVGSIVGAAIFTLANIWVKHNSVDTPEIDGRRPSLADRDLRTQNLFDNPPAPVFDLVDRIRQRNDQADGLNFLADKVGTKERIRGRKRRAKAA